MSRTSNPAGDDLPDGRVQVSFGRGVDNRSDDTALPDGYVRRAENVELSANGLSARRDGYELWVDLPGAHSAWNHPMLTFALVADATALYRLDDDATLVTLATGLNGGRLSYAQIGQYVYWSNRVQTGRIDFLGNTLPWGIETPLPSFGVSAIANGGLFAGRYGVAMSFGSATREEGGASETVFVDVPEGGGIQITGVPVSSDGSATEARVYVTEANSVELFHAGSAIPGVGQFMIGAGARTRVLTTQFCEPFPPAAHLLAKAGRLFGALGKRLVWSEALYYGLWRPTFNGLPFPDEITMIAAPDTAQFLLYVATRKKVYVLSGDRIESVSMNAACAAGAQPGSMVMAPAEVLHMDGVTAPIPLWAGTDGVPYAGMLSGVVPLSDNFVYPIYDQAAAALVQKNGLSRYIVSGRGGRTSDLAMGDAIGFEVVKAGP